MREKEEELAVKKRPSSAPRITEAAQLPNSPRHSTEVNTFFALESDHQPLAQIFLLVLHNFGEGVLKQIVAANDAAAVTRSWTLSWL